jgi:hypothetical protein
MGRLPSDRSNRHRFDHGAGNHHRASLVPHPAGPLWGRLLQEQGVVLEDGREGRDHGLMQLLQPAGRDHTRKPWDLQVVPRYFCRNVAALACPHLRKCPGSPTPVLMVALASRCVFFTSPSGSSGRVEGIVAYPTFRSCCSTPSLQSSKNLSSGNGPRAARRRALTQTLTGRGLPVRYEKNSRARKAPAGFALCSTWLAVAEDVELLLWIWSAYLPTPPRPSLLTLRP